MYSMQFLTRHGCILPCYVIAHFVRWNVSPWLLISFSELLTQSEQSEPFVLFLAALAVCGVWTGF